MIIADAKELLKSKEAQIALTLYRVTQGIETVTRKAGEAQGLSSSQVQTLLFLSDAHPSNRYIGSIAKRFKIASPTVTRIVDALEKKGLVKRIRGEKDRRSVKIKITNRGEDVVEGISDIGNFLQDMVASLSKEDKDILLHSLKEIMKTMQQKGYISLSMICRDCAYFEPNVKEDSKQPHRCLLTGENLSDDESYMEWLHPEQKPGQAS